MPFWFWLFFLGIAWVTAFAVQALGEKARLIRYHAPKWSDDEFFAVRDRFNRCTGPMERQQLERLVVIKEACGNAYVALLVGAVVWIADFFVDSGSMQELYVVIKASPLVFVLLSALMVFLAVMHFTHVDRQHHYMETLITERTRKRRSERSPRRAQ